MDYSTPRFFTSHAVSVCSPIPYTGGDNTEDQLQKSHGQDAKTAEGAGGEGPLGCVRPAPSAMDCRPISICVLDLINTITSLTTTLLGVLPCDKQRIVVHASESSLAAEESRTWGSLIWLSFFPSLM